MHSSAIRSSVGAIAVACVLAFGAGAALAKDDVAAKMNLSALQTGDQYDGFIVHFNKDSRAAAGGRAVESELSRIASRAGVSARHVRTLAAGGELIQLDQGLSRLDATSVMEAFAADADVAYIEPNALMRIAFTPNDTHYGVQWHYFEAAGGINAPPAWDLATGQGVTVAVLDTGSTNHPDLNANTVAGYDFISTAAAARDGNGRDSNPQDEGDWWTNSECGPNAPPSSNSSWHGTHVAGTVAAVTNNNQGVAGVAFGAKVQHARVLGKCGGSLADIADAIVWASGGSVSGVPANATPSRVINMSLGGGGSCGTTYQNAINSAVGRGSVVIVAAGNENQNASNSRPANCNNVVAVAAVGRNGGRASYSNFGTVVDVAAPGGSGSNGIASTMNSGTTVPASANYAYSQGTSMATPHVAGVAALMLQVNPALTPAQIESILKSTARSFPATCSGCGTGIVDALAAVQAAAGAGGGGPGPGPGVLQNGVPVTGLSASTGGELRFTLEVPAGASNLVFQISGGTGDADLYVRHGTAPTTSTWTCRPYQSGNNETCTFAAPAAGTWHVMVRAYSAFSGVSLVGSFSVAQQSFFENTTDYPILDLQTVESPIAVNRSGNAPSNLQVGVRIIHTYRGDLIVNLVAPDGTTYLLHNGTGGSNQNLIQTFTVNASNKPASGTWRLRVYDRYAGDTGYIDSWSLQF